MILVLFGISLIVFYLSRGYPTKFPPWGQYVTLSMSQAEIAYIKQIHGFNLPLYEQYFYWVRDAFSGNWGLSKWAGNQPTLTVFTNRFPLTVELAVSAIIITVAIGLPLGIVSATKNNKLPDHVSRIIALSGYAIPVFWLGFLFQLVFSYYFKLWGLPTLPSSGYVESNFRKLCPSYHWSAVAGRTFRREFFVSCKFFGASYTTCSYSCLRDFGLFDENCEVEHVGGVEARLHHHGEIEGTGRKSCNLQACSEECPNSSSNGYWSIVCVIVGRSCRCGVCFQLARSRVAALLATFQNDTNFLMLYTIVSAAIIVIANLSVDVLYGFIDPRIRLR